MAEQLISTQCDNKLVMFAKADSLLGLSHMSLCLGQAQRKKEVPPKTEKRNHLSYAKVEWQRRKKIKTKVQEKKPKLKLKQKQI